MSASVMSEQRSGGRALAIVQLVVMAGLVAALAVPFAASDVVGAGLGLKVALLGRMLLLALVAGWMLRSAGKGWADVGLRRPRRWWVVPLVVVAGYIGLGGLAAATHAVVLPALGLAAPDVSAFAGLRGDLPEYLFWALPVAFGSAAFGEELVARGFLTDRLATMMGGAVPGRLVLVVAVVLQGVLFGACHAYQGLGGALATGLVGIGLGLAWLVAGRNLWAPILLHGLVDFVSMSAFYAGVVGGPS